MLFLIYAPTRGNPWSMEQTNYLGEIIYPWHSYRFSLNTGEEKMRRCRDLKVYPVIAGSDGTITIEVRSLRGSSGALRPYSPIRPDEVGVRNLIRLASGLFQGIG